MKKSRVLITVPHATCLSTDPERHCDRRASAAAHMLQKLLASSQTTLLENDKVLRVVCDMNRPWCSHTAWRMEANSMMGADVFVVDMHSFDPEHNDFGPHTEVAFLDWTIPDAVTGHEGPALSALVDLVAELTGQGVNARVVDSSMRLNDIMKQARFLHGEAMLVEVREDLSDERLLFIIEAVARFVRNQVALISNIAAAMNSSAAAAAAAADAETSTEFLPSLSFSRLLWYAPTEVLINAHGSRSIGKSTGLAKYLALNFNGGSQ